MASHWLKGCLLLLVVALLVSPGQTAPPPAAPPAAEASGQAREVAALAQRIDQLIEAGYKAHNVKPAPLADDAEFLRRVYLDLTGRIPPVVEVHKFLASKDPDKRRALVDRLLDGPTYVNHFANVLRATIIPPSNNQQAQFFSQQIELYLRGRLREDMPYDKMVRDLLTAGFANDPNVRQPFNVNANVFFQANEFKPENLAASTSRLFMGVKLECAQCHDHPFAKWSKKQFWELAAFFTEFQQGQPGRRPVPMTPPQPGRPVKPEIKIPNTDKIVAARFLDGADPKFQTGTSPRVTLAAWITAADNPFFARAAANRFWSHFLGTGLIDPVDEMFSEENPASHPALLDELATGFARNNFDVKFLIRAITTSKTYQLTTASRDPSHDDPRLFARMALRGLTPEQFFDNLCQATGYRDNQAGMAQPRNVNQPGNNGVRAEFLARFADTAGKKTEHQTSILQALALMNGKFIADATSVERSQTLGAVAESPFLDTRQKLDTLFLSTLSRPMRPEEAERYQRYVEQGGPSGDPRKALADVFWVLLNSSEFSINH